MSAKPENERERIIAALMAVDGYTGPYTPRDGFPRYDLYAQAILASRQEAEPVAWLGTDADGNVSVTTEEDTRDRFSRLGRAITPLYAAPPASQAPAPPAMIGGARSDLVGRALHLADWAINQLVGEMIVSHHWTEAELDATQGMKEAHRAKGLIAEAYAAPAEAQARVEEAREFVEASIEALKHDGKAGREAAINLLERVPVLLSGSTPKPDEA